MTIWDMLLPVLFVGVVLMLIAPATRGLVKGVAVVLLALVGLRSKEPWDA